MFVSGKLLTKDCLEELTNGKNFIEDASFSPCGPPYAHVRCDVFRGLSDAFDSYYLNQVAGWRRRAGLGLYEATASPDKMQPDLGAQLAETVPVESGESSPPAVPPPTEIGVTKSADQPSGSSSVAELVKLKKGLQLGVTRGSSSSRGNSDGSRKRASQL